MATLAKYLGVRWPGDHGTSELFPACMGPRKASASCRCGSSDHLKNNKTESSLKAGVDRNIRVVKRAVGFSMVHALLKGNRQKSG